MTKPTIFIAAAAAFAVGFCVDFLIGPSRSGQRNETASRPEFTERISARPPSRSQEYKVLLREMTKSTIEEQLGRLDELDPGEYPALIEAFSSRTGFMRPSQAERQLMYRIVASWGAKDPDAALNWVLTLDNVYEHQKLLSFVIESVGKENLEEGLALLESLRKRPGLRPAVTGGLVKMATSQNADALLRVLCDPDDKGKASSGIASGRYAEDFDFKAVLDGIDEFQTTPPKGSVRTLPVNLLSEWSKRDPQAALDWVLLEKNVPFNSNLNDVVSGYSEIASYSEVGAMIANVHDARGDYLEVWRMLGVVGNEVALRDFLSAASGGESKDQLLQGLFTAWQRSIGSQGGKAKTESMRMMLMLIGSMEHQERIEAFANAEILFKKGGFTKELRSQLEALGHTPEEIERMNRKYGPGAK